MRCIQSRNLTSTVTGQPTLLALSLIEWLLLLLADRTTRQGSMIRSVHVRILFFERYVRTLTYSILAYAYPRALLHAVWSALGMVITSVCLSICLSVCERRCALCIITTKCSIISMWQLQSAKFILNDTFSYKEPESVFCPNSKEPDVLSLVHSTVATIVAVFGDYSHPKRRQFVAVFGDCSRRFGRL